MRKVVVLIGVAAILAAAAPQGGEPARCSIHKGLYEERQALASDPGGRGQWRIRCVWRREPLRRSGPPRP